MSTIRLNVWSGPRNISTALMYSFAQRGDTRVVDEPLYGHYLRVSGASHPAAQEVIDNMISDGNRVIQDIILGSCDQPILYLKQMAHHLVDIDQSFLYRTSNVLLIRDPREMLPSLAKVLTTPTLTDTGFAVQSELFSALHARGTPPPVLDAKQVLLNPRGVLTKLCHLLEIPFDDAMLTWEPGPRPEDGIWAKHWYSAVHRSSGFIPYRAKEESFPSELLPVLEDCLPHYQYLSTHAIQA